MKSCFNLLRLIFCLFPVLAWSATTSNETAKPVKFAVLGDVHLGLRGEDKGFKMTASSERLIEITIDQLNAMNDLSFVVFAGDLVVNGESFNLSRFKEIADRLRAPYFVILGNHDQPMIPSDAAWADGKRTFYPGETKAGVATLFRGHGFGADGRTWWSADIAGLHIVGLDTVQIKNWGGMVPFQELDWLGKDLDSARSKPTIVFMHHNLIESHPEYKLWPEFLVENRDDVKAQLSSFPQVQAAISAHYHFSDFHVESGIQYFTTPSINTYPCRFAVFEITPKTLGMRTHLVGESGKNRTEARSIRAKAKEEIFKAEDWMGSVARELENHGKPYDQKSVEAAVRTLFETNSSVPDSPLRTAAP